MRWTPAIPEDLMTRTLHWPVLLLALSAACGGGGETPPPPPSSGKNGVAPLTAFEQEHGIGPITSLVDLEPVDHELAEEGEEIFTVKCSACHKFDERYVGPALADVTVRRSPAYILNMVLNPQEMIERHPAAKQLLAEYLTYMPSQGLSEQEARQVLEYLRTKAPGAAR